jgi:erythromycin esterase-like protein
VQNLAKDIRSIQQNERRLWRGARLETFFIFSIASEEEEMKSNALLKLGLFLLVVLSVAWASSDQPEVTWIRNNAVKLQTVEAGHGFDDMQPLKKIVGNARIVSLGEATHGTREFFQLKHRMLEFLATNMDFSIFSIEANMPEAYRLNDFVLNGRGDLARLIKGMYFWTWDTQEVLDMILWMREFNKSGKGRLQFTGFDMQTPNVAAGIVDDFVAGADPDYAKAVRQATDTAKTANPAASGSDFGVATGTFPVKDATGKHIRFSGYIKTEGVTTGYAGLWWRVDGPSGVLAFDNMQSRGISGTTDWRRYDIELPVAAEARNINFGALFPGDGTAWFDELTVELDGKPYMNNDIFDFGFESPSPKGFYTGGNGYRVQLDSQVFHSGTQSLRMARVVQTNDPKAVDPKIASSTWRDVVRHLEASREAYQKKGAAARDIEWTIQNARVVLQCMQMKANEAMRDSSMADNVKWILDNNPGAKIVLWAHNGHVSTANEGGHGPMGASLRKMFGSQMVVFGFAFNQGSFQAIEQGKGLRDFTVPPAPEGSLDATFAAAGIPFFALDLRAAPKTGPVAAWLRQPHRARSIGAVFSDSSAAQYLMDLDALHSFDVVLFVEKTTAARKNVAK